MVQNLWVSPRGQEFIVQNHTSWLEQAFKTKLPPVDAVAHEIEKNRLYDWAFRMNWLKAQIDFSKRALYADPCPATGDQWRWLARRGAAGHLLIYDTDGKELANFQPGKRRHQESVDPKEFIEQQPERLQTFEEISDALRTGDIAKERGAIIQYPSIDFESYVVPAGVTPDPANDDYWGWCFGLIFDDSAAAADAEGYAKYEQAMLNCPLKSGYGGFYNIPRGGSWDMRQTVIPADVWPKLKADFDAFLAELRQRIVVPEVSMENTPAGHRDVYERRLVQRIKLGVGVEAYVREAIDAKDFIMSQPIFGFHQFGSATSIYVSGPEFVKRGSRKYRPDVWQPHAWHKNTQAIWYVACIIEDSNGRWRLYAVDEEKPDDKRKQQALARLYTREWPTKEDAANEIWNVLFTVQQESMAFNPRDWLLNLKEPRARDVDYKVILLVDGDEETVSYPFKSLEKAVHRAIQMAQYYSMYQPQGVPPEQTMVTIEKQYRPTGGILARWKVQPSGGLLPLAEAIDPKKFIAKLPNETVLARKVLRRYGFRPMIGDSVVEWDSPKGKDALWYARKLSAGYSMDVVLDNPQNFQFSISVHHSCWGFRLDAAGDIHKRVYAPELERTIKAGIAALHDIYKVAGAETSKPIVAKRWDDLCKDVNEAVDPKEFIAGTPEPSYRIRKTMLAYLDAHGNQYPNGLSPTEMWLRIADYKGERKLFTWHRKKEKATVFDRDEAESVLARVGGSTDIVQETIDARKFVLSQPEQRYWVMSDVGTYWGKCGKYWYWHADPTVVLTLTYEEAETEYNKLVTSFNVTTDRAPDDPYGKRQASIVLVDEKVLAVWRKRNERNARRRQQRQSKQFRQEALDPKEFVIKTPGKWSTT